MNYLGVKYCMKAIAFICVFFGLSACVLNATKDPDSPLYSVPTGSTLVLNKTITIPANLARRYFQNGKAMNEKEVNIYYPHCSILLNTLENHDRTLKPTSFEIYKVEDGEQFAQQAPIRVASLAFGGGRGSILGFVSRYFLRSNNPDVRSLECLQWGFPMDTEYLSINEVKQSLGDYFTLDIKQLP